jgi:hypothetical protein
MREIFVGSDTLARGSLTRARLRWNFRPIFPDVYMTKGVVPSLGQRTVGAWLWSGRNGVIAGRAAAAMHGARWVRAETPVEMIWRCGRPPPGIQVRNERIDAIDVVVVDDIPVTSPERTAFDLARHLPRDLAVAHLDALARVTGIDASGVLQLADRYPRARGLARARIALPLRRRSAVPSRDATAFDSHQRWPAFAANSDRSGRRDKPRVHRHGLRRAACRIRLRRRAPQRGTRPVRARHRAS